MKVFVRIFPIAAGLFLSIQCYAAQPPPAPLEEDCGAWLPVSMKFPILRHWQGYFEVQPRFQKLHEGKFSENIIRTGLGYEFNKRWSVFSGYYWSAHFDKELDNEKRLWQQITWSGKLGKCNLQSRLRCEESRRATFEGTAVRVRDQVRIAYPLGRTPWYLTASEEPIININSPPHGPQAGFAQNRFFLGVGKRLNHFTRVEVGYMNQYRNARTAKPDTVNHVLVASLSFDFTAPKSQSRLATKPPMQPETAKSPDLIVCVPQIIPPEGNFPCRIFSTGQTGESGNHTQHSNLHPSLRRLAGKPTAHL